MPTATRILRERGCRSAEEEGEDDGADVDVAEAAQTLVAFQAAPAPKRECLLSPSCFFFILEDESEIIVRRSPGD